MSKKDKIMKSGIKNNTQESENWRKMEQRRRSEEQSRRSYEISQENQQWWRNRGYS